MRALLISLMLWATAFSAAAQTVVDSPEAAKTSLTIYPDNLAMVTEVRRVTLPKGPATIRFLGVSDQIIPQSAVLQEFEGLSLERNFDTDVISKGSLMEKAVGEIITIRRVNPATGGVSEVAAKLLAAPLQGLYRQNNRRPFDHKIQGAVFEVDGRVEALECSGLAEAVLYSQLPEGLNPSPVLSLSVESETAGETEVTISYLTRGLGWEADYRMDMPPQARQGSLLGWLTLTNGTSKNFKNVPTAIVAGTLNRARDDYMPALTRIFTPNCWPKGSTKTGISNTDESLYRATNIAPGALRREAPPVAYYSVADLGAQDEVIATASRRQAVREDLGDYKLYRTPEPVTVAPMQTKQIAFLNIPDVEADRVFAFSFSEAPEWGPMGATVEYRVDNSQEGNLAQPLPKGNFRVFTNRENGAPAYLGEDSVDNLAVDLPVDIEVSRSIAVQMQSRIEGISRGEGDDAVHEIHLTADIFNATSDKVETEVEIRELFLRQDDISETSHAHDPEEIIPTYPITLKPESAEQFKLVVPMQQLFYFDYNDLDFEDEDYIGETQTSYAIGRYGLSSSLGGGDNWANQYFNQITGLSLKIDTTLLAYSKTETEDGDEEITAELKHVIKNTTNKTAKMAFVLPDEFETLHILSSSIEPDKSNENAWVLELKPGQRRVLSYELLVVE